MSEEHTGKRPVLAQFYQELEHRLRTARLSLKEKYGGLDGAVPLPENQPPEVSLGYQMTVEHLLVEEDG